VQVRDAANGFAGVFAENQATVTWSVTSDSGFSFTSNPGNFSTSVPEIPGINGVTAPLNFFAQVGFERNGIFFPQGQTQASAESQSAGALAPVAIASGNTVGSRLLGGPRSGETALVLQATLGHIPGPLVDHSVVITVRPAHAHTGPNNQDVRAIRNAILQR